MRAHSMSLDHARRVAVQAQVLDSNRAMDLVRLVERLTLLQLDPTAAIAPSADLVAWSRLGARYRPADLVRAIEVDRVLFELGAVVRPMSDLGLYLADMRSWPRSADAREWLEVNDSFRRDILAHLESAGPLLSREIPDTSVEPWRSTGWTNERNVTQMLEFLTKRGEVAIAGRQGRQRLWDLAARVYPSGVDVVSSEEARRRRDVRRIRSLGIARPKLPLQAIEPYDVGEAGEPAVIEDVPGEWRVDPEILDLEFEGRTALLSPFDRLVHDRRRAEELFGFEYTLEMYKPPAERRWGYFALPILHGDRLVGKLDARADRKSTVFHVFAVHEDIPFDGATRAGVRDEIERLAAWLELEVVDG